MPRESIDFWPIASWIASQDGLSKATRTMRAVLRTWRRELHRVVLRRLRSPSADALDNGGVVSQMPWLSALYGRVIETKRRRALASAQRISPVEMPVISVGNFTFGATGKTPCVLFLADEILRHTATRGEQHKSNTPRVPMLLTRGYGDDEWRMFVSRFPSCQIAVGADRFTLGRQSVARHGSLLSCVLLDDGLQQWKIRKDLEIVMVDALAPFGNGKLIPHGSLRELPVDALARADVVLLHHANLLHDTTRLQQLVSTIQSLTSRERKTVVGTSEMAVIALPSLSSYQPSKITYNNAFTPDWNAFRGKTALIVCGVGNPESVELVVRVMGCWARVEIEAFPDHHAFTEPDLANVRARLDTLQASLDGGDEDHNVVVVITEKDHARCASLLQRTLDGYHVHVLVAGFQLGAYKEAVLNRVKNVLES